MGDRAASRRLTPRQWRVLSFLALHGLATTVEVAVVAGVPRLTAHRDLTRLHGLGLVERRRSDEDRTHTWWYDVTAEGAGLVARDLAASGRPVPLELGRRRWNEADGLLFLPLIEASRQSPGRCELFGWLTTMDTSVWLRGHGLAHLRADGFGVWLEDGRCLRFLVHVDNARPSGLLSEEEQRTAGLEVLLAGYRRTDPAVPVGAVLVVARDADHEDHLLEDLARRPVRAPIAISNIDLLGRQWPNEAVWRVPGEDGTRQRLIDLAP
ncbi:MarR family transcriptional regulator [Polymorphospora rubra]|uniref:MarR family transcriptional regulator n=1 Tax=Polymorphospora rubra TaxID=338584 RepID=UPI0033EBA948